MDPINPENPLDFGKILGQLGGLGGASELLKQAQELPAKMDKIKKEAQEKSIRISAGGGALQIVCRGSGEIISLKIDPLVVESTQIEELEDLLRAGVNESLRQAREMVHREVAKATDKLQIPPGLLDGMA